MQNRTRSHSDELEFLRSRWPNECTDGASCALLQEYPGARERAGYPKGFHDWPLERRNAWFAGYNYGFHERIKLALEVLGQ
jgi:hypothetical protein